MRVKASNPEVIDFLESLAQKLGKCWSQRRDSDNCCHMFFCYKEAISFSGDFYGFCSSPSDNYGSSRDFVSLDKCIGNLLFKINKLRMKKRDDIPWPEDYSQGLFAASDNRANNEYSWSGIYFHKSAEDLVSKFTEDCSPDIISCNREMPNKDGIYRCSIYGSPAKLYLWNVEDRESEGEIFRHGKGLVCLESDVEANKEAHESFSDKRSCI